MDLHVLFSIVIGLVGLVVGGEFLVRGASKLASALGIPSIIIGLTVVAFGTSTPELAVSLDAALSGNADIAVANVVGSNIFNILLILGVSALIMPLVIHSQMITREVPIMIGASVFLLLFSLNGYIGRLEGILLCIGIIAYTGWLVFEALKNKKEDRVLQKESENEFPPVKASAGTIVSSLLFVAGGLGIVMYGAEKLVEGSTILAKALGVSDAVIGLTIVAAGTSLPEVVASVLATIKGERDIAVGNVVGSNIYNILAIVGISGATAGLNVNPAMIRFDIPLMIGVSVFCWFMFRRANSLSRIGGGIFLGLYIAYTAYLIQTAAG